MEEAKTQNNEAFLIEMSVVVEEELRSEYLRGYRAGKRDGEFIGELLKTKSDAWIWNRIHKAYLHGVEEGKNVSEQKRKNYR